jgi:sugar/nucleoside kinase (ribokinase family)
VGMARRQMGEIGVVIVGHLATNEDRTPFGTEVSVGGSAYYCAVGASVMEPSRVGVVAPIGNEFDLDALARLGVDHEGVRRYPGETPHFIITQTPEGTRMFDAAWGVAGQARIDAFPTCYADAKYVHLSTAPPRQQLAWITWLRRHCPQATVSVDVFEAFATNHPAESRRACLLADVVFLNDDEARLLAWSRPEGNAQATILKHGPGGAEYLDVQGATNVPAIAVPATETTGAGDILAGVFLCLTSLGMTPTVALRHAVTVATASVQSFGVDTTAVRTAIDQARGALGLVHTVGQAG